MAKKLGYSFSYDVGAAMESAGSLLGMELHPKGDHLEGGYYLNGEPHQYRRDKLKVFVGRGNVWVMEEGGRCISLPQWLIEFGGAADYREALKMIKSGSSMVHWQPDFERLDRTEIRYVDADVLRGAKAFDLEKSPLYRWMCTLFAKKLVRNVWERYNVTADDKGRTTFWYVNGDGKICHDKKIYYREDGHRDKIRPMGRDFRVRDGYTGRCFFGAHLSGEVKGILESEKSCLYAACFYGGIWLATGGLNALKTITDIPLYPDRDGESKWMQYGDCVDWYKDWYECGEHSDLGDYIEWQILRER